LWIGAAVLGATHLFVLPFSKIPGAQTEIVGRLTLADATLLAGAILAPIALVARPLRPRRSL
jgi:hypothetical protein